MTPGNQKYYSYHLFIRGLKLAADVSAWQEISVFLHFDTEM